MNCRIWDKVNRKYVKELVVHTNNDTFTLEGLPSGNYQVKDRLNKDEHIIEYMLPTKFFDSAINIYENDVIGIMDYEKRKVGITSIDYYLFKFIGQHSLGLIHKGTTLKVGDKKDVVFYEATNKIYSPASLANIKNSVILGSVTKNPDILNIKQYLEI